MTTISVPAPDASGGPDVPPAPAPRPAFRHARTAPRLLPGTRERIPSLDGLRAIAVALVVVYHVLPDWMPAGFLGVSLFFTLSGFLITRLLLAELTERGDVGLRSFWGRRFRRLMPASLATLAVVTVAWVAVGWMTRAIGGDIVAAVADVANWRFLVTGTAYGAATDASPVLHFWSLAIEEQFYLAYPLIVWVVARRRANPARALGIALTVLLVGSVAYTLSRSGEPLTVYFSTFSRAAEVLVGALAAVLTWRLGRPRRAGLIGLVGLAALLGIIGLSLRSGLYDAAWAHGGLAAVAVLSSLAVLGATQRGPLRQWTSARPLVRIGEISYGIYLFHWPILVALQQGTSLSPGLRALVTVVAAVVLAEVSIRVLEHPVRVGAWRRVRPAVVAVPVVALVVGLSVWGGNHSSSPTFTFAGEKGVEDLGALPVPTTAPATEGGANGAAGAAVPAGPVAISFYGDSTAWQMRLAMQAWGDPRFEVRPGWNDIGCTISRGGPYKGDYDTDKGYDVSVDRCDWTQRWPDTVRAGGTELAVVYGGVWDTMPRKVPGLWSGYKTIEDPEGADHERAEMVALSDALHEAGARKVVWLTLAPNTQRNAALNIRRVAIWNQLLSEAAAQRPDEIAVVDIAGWFAGQPKSIRPDGVHVTEDTGRVVLDEYLAAQLLAAAGR